MKQFKVLVLGGTGAMGAELVALLAERGFEVTVTSRSARTSDLPRVRFVTGDAKSPDFLKVILSECFDAVVDFMIWSTDEFRSVAPLVLRSTGQYVFVSSYRVYADSKLLTEESPRLLDACKDAAYLRTDEYALKKARCEDILFGNSSRNWTIARPGITYNGRVGRLQLGVMESRLWLWRALNGCAVAFPREMADKKTTVTWGGDVARMLSGLVYNDAAVGETFNVATAECLTWREVIELYASVVPLNVSWCSVDDYMRVMSNVYQVRYDRMFDRKVDNSKALAAAGMRQAELLSPFAGLVRELRACIDLDTIPTPVPGENGRMDRLIGGFPTARPLAHAGCGMSGLARYVTRRLM